MRDRETAPVRFTVAPEGSRLDILVENMGRNNFDRHLNDRKGINGFVVPGVEQPDGSVGWFSGFLMNWDIRTLPMRDISALTNRVVHTDMPVFYRGTFRAEPGVDTFADMAAWNKGCVWVNGFHLGRYWNVGPQQALYLPGELLRKENEIVILELQPDHDPVAAFRDTPALVGNLTDKPVHQYKAED